MLITGRKSISAMHNIDNKTTSISKSYTNSKKEELLKVINEAKQKLENVSIKFYVLNKTVKSMRESFAYYVS